MGLITGTGALPTACPHCGSTDTGEKHEGDPDCLECFHFEAFWYFCNPRLREWETVPGTVRARANAEYEAAEDRRLFGSAAC